MWEAHVGALLHRLGTCARTMTREEVDAICRQYLQTKFDEIEARLSRPLTEEDAWGTSFYLNEEAHRGPGSLNWGRGGWNQKRKSISMPNVRGCACTPTRCEVMPDSAPAAGDTVDQPCSPVTLLT